MCYQERRSDKFRREGSIESTPSSVVTVSRRIFSSTSVGTRGVVGEDIAFIDGEIRGGCCGDPGIET